MLSAFLFFEVCHMKISASRLKSYKACKRRYAWSYLYGEREPFARSAQAGTEVHNLLEKDDFKGDEVWEGYQTGRMAALLKAETPADVVSRERSFDVTLHGVDWTGRIDFTTKSAVGDYKTTSQPKYVKLAETLEDDEQRLLYSEVTELPDSVWLFGAWRNFKAYPVVIPGNRQRDREKFKLHVLQPAEELSVIPTDVDPLTLEANTLSCGLYPPKGCPFTSRCFDNFTGALIVKSISSAQAEPAQQNEDNEMSVLDAFKAPATAPSAEAADDGKLIGILYIDCYPVSGVETVKHAGELISKASATVASDAHVLHSQLVDFGKGAHMLAAQLADDLKTAGVFYPHVYLETRSAEGKAVLFVLTGMARIACKAML
jgi:hypothetical protein